MPSVTPGKGEARPSSAIYVVGNGGGAPAAAPAVVNVGSGGNGGGTQHTEGYGFIGGGSLKDWILILVVLCAGLSILSGQWSWSDNPFTKGPLGGFANAILKWFKYALGGFFGLLVLFPLRFKEFRDLLHGGGSYLYYSGKFLYSSVGSLFGRGGLDAIDGARSCLNLHEAKDAANKAEQDLWDAIEKALKNDNDGRMDAKAFVTFFKEQISHYDVDLLQETSWSKMSIDNMITSAGENVTQFGDKQIRQLRNGWGKIQGSSKLGNLFDKNLETFQKNGLVEMKEFSSSVFGDRFFKLFASVSNDARSISELLIRNPELAQNLQRVTRFSRLGENIAKKAGVRYVDPKQMFEDLKIDKDAQKTLLTLGEALDDGCQRLNSNMPLYTFSDSNEFGEAINKLMNESGIKTVKLGGKALRLGKKSTAIKDFLDAAFNGLESDAAKKAATEAAEQATKAARDGIGDLVKALGEIR